MAQLARQHEANELRELFVKIDEKLDDVRRRQRDEVLAKMDRVSFVIEEALTIREHGGDRETAWEKVKPETGTIAEVQADALRALEALADNVDGKSKVGDLAKGAKQIEHEVGVWLAVLVRCFQLQDEYRVLELDHVFDNAPSSLDGHRLGLSAALQARRAKVLKKTKHLMTRMDAAGGIAESNFLLHVRDARSVVNSINQVGVAVDEFHLPFEIGVERDSLKSTRLRDAIRDPQQLKNAAAEAGPKVAVGALALGVGILTVVFKNSDSKDVGSSGN